MAITSILGRFTGLGLALKHSRMGYLRSTSQVTMVHSLVAVIWRWLRTRLSSPLILKKWLRATVTLVIMLVFITNPTVSKIIGQADIYAGWVFKIRCYILEKLRMLLISQVTQGPCCGITSVSFIHCSYLHSFFAFIL